MNKTAKKVIRILAKVFLIIESVSRVLLIFPIILAFFAFKVIDLEDEKHVKAKLVWAIIFIALGIAPVAGTLMLVDSIFGLAKLNKTEEKAE